MRRRFVGALVLFAFCGALLGAMSVARAEARRSSRGSDFRILHHEELPSLSLEAAIQQHDSPDADVAAASVAGRAVSLSFDALGRHFDLVLEPNDRLVANLPKAQKERLRASVRVFRGRVAGVEDSWVRLTRIGDQFSGMIWDGAEIYVIDSSDRVAAALELASAASRAYQLIYRLSDARSKRARCALAPAEEPMNDYGAMVDELRQLAPALATAAWQLDLAVVADVAFIQNTSGDPEAAVLAHMNVVDGIYSEQVDVHLNLAELRLLQSNGSLTSTDPYTLLRQFGSLTSSSGFDHPGLAHLITGRDLNGRVIGIAYLGSLCSSKYGVGLSQAWGTGTATALTVAHEVGHNFGAPHDNQSGSSCSSTPNGFIMNPSANGSDQFSQCSVQQMQPHIARAACITELPGGADVRVSLPADPLSASVDAPFDFNVDVSNLGAEAADNAQVAISLPSALSVLDAQADTGSCDYGAGDVTCALGRIASGGSRSVTLTLQGTQPGSFTATAIVSADNAANDTARATITISAVSGGDPVVFEAHFDTDKEGFTFVDDAFRNTREPYYARGYYLRRGGFSGGGLNVYLGGINHADIFGMSGGWERTFTLDARQRVTLSLRYKLVQARDYEPDEFSEALVSVDGMLVGSGGTDSLASIRGDGNGGVATTTGWVDVELDLGYLSAGSHTVTLGAFNNKKTYSNETTQVTIDDVMIRGN